MQTAVTGHPWGKGGLAMNILYITCNPKPQEQSACLTIGREFVDALRQEEPHSDFTELDLYTEDIPELDFAILTARARLVEGPAYDRLPAPEKAKADRVRYLANMFRQADRVVIAAPMWSLSFPGRLKNYLDCVLLDGITVSITDNKVSGLMNDVPRAFVYVQASGGPFHSLLLMPLNFGNNYMKLIAKTLGFSDYFALPVDGTGSTLQETHAAMDKARKLIPETVEKVDAVR